MDEMKQLMGHRRSLQIVLWGINYDILNISLKNGQLTRGLFSLHFHLPVPQVPTFRVHYLHQMNKFIAKIKEKLPTANISESFLSSV